MEFSVFFFYTVSICFDSCLGILEGVFVSFFFAFRGIVMGRVLGYLVLVGGDRFLFRVGFVWFF